MQVYVLHKSPITSAQLLKSYSARARCTNLREGQQIFSTCMIQLGWNPLYKLDGSDYKLNHPHSPIVKWFGARNTRLTWLFSHLYQLTMLYYPTHHTNLVKWYTDNSTMFWVLDFVEQLDSIPWYPVKHYTGTADIPTYIRWKYGDAK